jgi:hypothetical protein
VLFHWFFFSGLQQVTNFCLVTNALFHFDLTKTPLVVNFATGVLLLVQFSIPAGFDGLTFGV